MVSYEVNVSLKWIQVQNLKNIFRRSLIQNVNIINNFPHKNWKDRYKYCVFIILIYLKEKTVPECQGILHY